MQDNPLASVVIPVHNGERYIKEALESCLNQTYDNFEILIVDDKSEDGTLGILKEFESRDRRVKVFAVEKQDGLGNVINIGIRASKGKYIVRMDADDVMCSDRIEKQVKYLEENPECVAIGGQIDIIDENSNITGHREYPLTDKELRKNLFLFQPFAHPAVTLRRSTLEEMGLYPENMWKVEDVKLFLILSTKGKFANVPDTVLRYRMTFKTESQAKMVDHFRRTSEMRSWAVKNLNIKPTFRESVIWFIQRMGVTFLGLLPPKMFMWVFENVRKILK